MVKNKGRIIAVSIFTVLSVLLIMGNYSCKKIQNPNEGKNTKDTIQFDLLSTRIFVQFVDANTNQNITTYNGGSLSVEIVGKSNMMVADILGITKEKYYPQNGFLTLSLLPEVTPSSGSPVSFTVRSSIYNHISGAKEITITEEGDYYVKIPMINLDLPPEGVLIEKLANVGNLYKGVVRDDITISIPTGEAQVKIPAGTKLIARDSTLLSGNVNLTLVYHNLSSDIGMATIQGGIASSIFKNNYVANVLHFPGAIIDILITDSDFIDAYYVEDKMLEVDVTIPDDTYNPSGWSNYKNGDQVEVFTYLPDTGFWNYEKSVTITANSGELKASVSSSGLHSYNFSNFKTVSCNDGPNFKVAGECDQCNSVLLDGILRKEVDDSFISYISVTGERVGGSEISQRTGNNKVYIDWDNSNECNGCIVDPAHSPTSMDNMCTQNDTYLPLVDNGSSPISIIASFSGQCASDTNFLILPAFGVWTRHIDSPCWMWTSMDNGTAQLCNLTFGETYIIGTYFDDMWQQWEVTIDNESDYKFILEFSDAICNDVFGIL